jgi:hypothetical protein
MKWIGQHIYDLVARFRNDVYLEDLSTTTETNVLVVDSDGKVSKTTVITGDVTGVTAGSNITVTNPTGPVPTVALNTSLTGLTSITSTSFVGALTGNADTVTTNADLTGPVTSTGNTTAIASGAITTAMQKHLQTFEFNGYLLGTNTNYYFPSGISTNTGPFKHDVLGGASGTTAITTQNLIRMGGKVMPYSGTVQVMERLGYW